MPGSLFTVITVKVIIVPCCLITEHKRFWRCQSKGPGAEVMWMHIHTHTSGYSCHPDLVIPLSLQKMRELGEQTFTSQMPWFYFLGLPDGPLDSHHPLLLCICLEHKCQNKHGRYRSTSWIIIEPVLTDDLCLWSNACGKQRSTSHFQEAQKTVILLGIQMTWVWVHCRISIITLFRKSLCLHFSSAFLLSTI